MNGDAAMELEVHHDAARSQFRATVDGMHSVLDYELDNGVLTVTHTGVPPAMRGRGIAEQLTRAMLAHCHERGWSLRPLCAYTAAFVRRHPPVDVQVVD